MHRTTTIRSAVLMAALLVSTIAAAASSAPPVNDITDKFIAAGVQVPDLHAVEVGGIVVLRGTAASPVEAENAAKIASDLGYTRVANLVRVIQPADDANQCKRRTAQRSRRRHVGRSATPANRTRPTERREQEDKEK